MFDREKAISVLVELLVEDFNQGVLCLDNILIDGYRGIDDLSDEELMVELEDRDVSYLLGDNDE
jgi:hypothetical protein